MEWLQIDQTGQVLDRIPVGRGPTGVVVAAGEVWVANPGRRFTRRGHGRRGQHLGYRRTGGPDVLAARQALNYAIDRATLIQLIGGTLMAQPTCQILPAAMPGYQPYWPYTINPSSSGGWTAPDLAKAERLVTASGTRGAKGCWRRYRDSHGETSPKSSHCCPGLLMQGS